MLCFYINDFMQQAPGRPKYFHWIIKISTKLTSQKVRMTWRSIGISIYLPPSCCIDHSSFRLKPLTFRARIYTGSLPARLQFCIEQELTALGKEGRRTEVKFCNLFWSIDLIFSLYSYTMWGHRMSHRNGVMQRSLFSPFSISCETSNVCPHTVTH